MSDPPFDPYGQPPEQPTYPPPGGQAPHGYRPPAQPARVVTKQHMRGGAHTVHLILTVCTCGLWAPIWFLHWLFTRNKTVTRY